MFRAKKVFKGGVVPVSVDGVTEAQDIANLFKDQFKWPLPLATSQHFSGIEYRDGAVPTLIKVEDIRAVLRKMN